MGSDERKNLSVRHLVGVGGVVFLSVNAAPSSAQSMQPQIVRPDHVCSGYVTGWSLDDYIESCTRLIQERADNYLAVAAALNDRARFHMQRRDFARAMADLTRAVEVTNRRYVLAFRNRALAHMQRHEFELAQQDYNEALALLADGRAIELLRRTEKAELRLGLGFAYIGLGRCNFADTASANVEPWPTRSEGWNVHWKMAGEVFKDVLKARGQTAERARTAGAYFGLGLSTKLLGTQRLRSGQRLKAEAVRRPSLGPAAQAVVGDGNRLVTEGEGLMRSARVLYPAIDQVIRDDFGMVATVCGLTS